MVWRQPADPGPRRTEKTGRSHHQVHTIAAPLSHVVAGASFLILVRYAGGQIFSNRGEGMLQFITNSEIYEQVLEAAVPAAEKFVWIATADIKDCYVQNS